MDTAVLGGGEEAGDHHHCVLLGELLDQLGEGVVVRNRHIPQIGAEGGECRLGQQHQVSTLLRGLCHCDPHGRESLLDILGDLDLGQRDPRPGCAAHLFEEVRGVDVRPFGAGGEQRHQLLLAEPAVEAAQAQIRPAAVRVRDRGERLAQPAQGPGGGEELEVAVLRLERDHPGGRRAAGRESTQRLGAQHGHVATEHQHGRGIGSFGEFVDTAGESGQRPGARRVLEHEAGAMAGGELIAVLTAGPTTMRRPTGAVRSTRSSTLVPAIGSRVLSVPPRREEAPPARITAATVAEVSWGALDMPRSSHGTLG